MSKRDPNRFEPDDLAALVPAERARIWYGPLLEATRRYKITTAKRQAHFLAQILHESMGLAALEENLNYSAQRICQVWPARFPTVASAAMYAWNPQALANRVYANRLGNGNEASGDGWRYRGRGPIQITGRSNYAVLSRRLDVDFVNHPDLLFEPCYGALAAADYWDRRGINAAADADDLERVTRLVNGGLNGLEDRRRWLERAKRALGVTA